jgi:hypothetical protein
MFSQLLHFALMCVTYINNWVLDGEH